MYHPLLFTNVSFCTGDVLHIINHTDHGAIQNGIQPREYVFFSSPIDVLY